MSTEATSTGKPVSTTGNIVKPDLAKAKDKGKGTRVEQEEEEEEDEDEDEDEEDEDEDDTDDEAADVDEDSLEEIDPRDVQIIGRRTRGVKVDYTSREALAKAGLKPEGENEDDDEDMAL